MPVLRTALFVDAANMFYAQRDNGWQIEYRKVYEYFSRGRILYGAYYFTGTPPVSNIQAVNRYRRFKRALIHIGYTVIDKEVKVIKDKATGQRLLKGDLDVEITLHMLAAINGYDECVLLGGDSDFYPLLSHLRSCGKVVVCVGRKQSTALEIVNIANRFVDLNDIRSEIEKTKT